MEAVRWRYEFSDRGGMEAVKVEIMRREGGSMDAVWVGKEAVRVAMEAVRVEVWRQ